MLAIASLVAWWWFIRKHHPKMVYFRGQLLLATNFGENAAVQRRPQKLPFIVVGYMLGQECLADFEGPQHWEEPKCLLDLQEARETRQ